MKKKPLDPEALTSDERNALADKYRVNRAWMYQCLTGRGDMKPIEAARVERESGGAITRQMLCRNTYRLVWPELAAKEAATRRRKRK